MSLRDVAKPSRTASSAGSSEPFGASPVDPDLRILVVATHIAVPGTRGGHTHVTELHAHLSRLAPTLLLGRRGSTGHHVVGAGLWKTLPPKGMAHLLSGVNLARSLSAVRAFQPNVIYERGSSFGLGAYYSKLFDIPLLSMLLDEHISPLSLRRARKIICTNVETVPEAFRHKAVKVSWGANTELFNAHVSGEETRQKYGLAGALVVGYSGSFQPWHGLELLLDVAEKTEQVAGKPVKFLLIGDGRHAPVIRQEVEQRGLTERVLFTGAVPYADMPRTLAAADICVAPFDPDKHSPSAKAGYQLDPLKLFEYLALRKPVVTIEADNICRLFKHEEHLLAVPPRDADAFASAIERLATDADFAQRMASSGHAKVQREHTWDSHARHLVQLFTEMRSESRTPRHQ